MMDAAALMSLWKTDELPACDEGMVLALEFLTNCVEAVESGDSAEFNMRINTLSIIRTVTRSAEKSDL
jgi:hypothetical protein